MLCPSRVAPANFGGTQIPRMYMQTLGYCTKFAFCTFLLKSSAKNQGTSCAGHLDRIKNAQRTSHRKAQNRARMHKNGSPLCTARIAIPLLMGDPREAQRGDPGKGTPVCMTGQGPPSARAGTGRGAVYTRELGTICPFGVFPLVS